MQRSKILPTYAGFAIGCLTILVFLVGKYSVSIMPAKISISQTTDAGSSSKVGPSNSDTLIGELSPNATIITPGFLGVILNNSHPKIWSPNGRYSLALSKTGNVLLKEGRTPLWWTNTGDNFAKDSHTLTLSSSGELAVNLKPNRGSLRKVWHSSLLRQCSEQVSDPSTAHQLTLSDDGELVIHPRCNLYAPPPKRSSGKLALVVSGLYRTNKRACRTHMRYLISNPAFASVDVFVYALYEKQDIDGKVTPSSIEADIRGCYGEYLRKVTVKLVEEVEEVFPGEVFGPCGGKLHRLQNQLKTLYNSGMMWWTWSLQNGTTHDTVLRVRTDSKFGGKTVPTFMSADEMGKGKVVIPHTVPPTYFYCPFPNGDLNVGPSDQMAYGSPSAMHIWFSFSNYFSTIIQQSSDRDSPAFRDFSGCEELPTGPEGKECNNPAPCSVECIEAYYINAMGMEYEIEWGWDISLLR